ncbi:hypothetical protein SteCoe_23120 [Stentor coeruleus]|uniref:Uncharacterized protein n=1 Tax=Stentor coeruleus TaxID=5963 RepID=A0A1R2BKK2_9CILI|nr:hypothetical protein SteCoe_23120 [Stentor coeruleus]
MCKLNILCKQQDGQCNCYQKNHRSLVNSQSQNGLLSSILNFIKDQPEIIKSLSETSKIPIDEVLASFSSINQASIDDSYIKDETNTHYGIADLQINILSDIPNRIIVGKSFPIMAEVVNKSIVKVDLSEPETFQVVLVGKNDGLDKLVVAEEVTRGIALFRKIVINQEISQCALVVRIKGKSEITQFCQDIKIKSRGLKEKNLKKFKADKILA